MSKDDLTSRRGSKQLVSRVLKKNSILIGSLNSICFNFIENDTINLFIIDKLLNVIEKMLLIPQPKVITCVYRWYHYILSVLLSI